MQLIPAIRVEFLRPQFLRPSIFGLTLLLAACASAPPDERSQINSLVAHGQYADAVRAAANLHEKNPDDPAATETYQRTSVAYLLEQGRRLTFDDKDLEALDVFTKAKAIDPDSPEILSWIEKTRHKIAIHWLEAALELHANDELEAAVTAYRKALEYAPDDPSALAGLGTAVLAINFRESRGKGYFTEGLHALAQFWLEQARSRFSYSGKYLPKDERTTQRRAQVDRLLAEQRVTVAHSLEGRRRYAAARQEYRLALALDPQNTVAKEGLERATKERKAADVLSNAHMGILRGHFDQAQTMLEQGAELTVAQKDLFEGALAEVQEARFEKMYDKALALERDNLYEKAVESYGDLLSKTPYFKDALTRKETLEEYIRLANELYQKAQVAPSNVAKLELLHQIRVIWPEYKDLAQQIKDLEPIVRAEKAASEEAQKPGDGAGKPAGDGADKPAGEAGANKKPPQ